MDAREPSVQGDKQDLPALWTGPVARPHPVLAAEPSSPLDASVQCCTLSGFWSPPARLTIRLSKEKAKKRKGRALKINKQTLLRVSANINFIIPEIAQIQSDLIPSKGSRPPPTSFFFF